MKLKYPERLRLAQTLTPLHRMEFLSKSLNGPEILVKRDFGLFPPKNLVLE